MVAFVVAFFLPPRRASFRDVGALTSRGRQAISALAQLVGIRVDVAHRHFDLAVSRELPELIDLHHLAAARDAGVPSRVKVKVAAVVCLVRDARGLQVHP
ncbi:MAG TPA: hypothetical protein VGR35_12625 [Tepidisphaeraceae bacterium]|nr:hypothetical protein [Tepidisphaeraceae bacterium]